MDNIVEHLNRLNRVLDPLLMIKPDNVVCVITIPDKMEMHIFLSGIQMPLRIEAGDQDKPSYRTIEPISKQIASSLRISKKDYKALLLFFKKISVSALPERGELNGDKWEKMGLGVGK